MFTILKKKKVWIPGLILVTATVWFFMKKTGSDDMIFVNAEKIELRTIVQKINASGKIQPRNQSKLPLQLLVG